MLIRFQLLAVDRVKALSCVLALVLPMVVVAQDKVRDPVPEFLDFGTVTVKLEDFASMPETYSGSTLSRINHLKPPNDGSGRVFVNDLHGEMYVLDSEGNHSLYFYMRVYYPRLKISSGQGTGYTSFSFHPEFATNGKFYTAHSEEPGSGEPDFVSPDGNDTVTLQGVIVEWTADDPSANVFSGSRREVVRFNIIGSVHGMQEISFNTSAKKGDPDYGNLYICIGDGGATTRGLPDLAHRLDSHLGTILRIDPSGTNSANGEYGIPDDNPWANDGDPDTMGEIWVYGFRNPHRIAWDSKGDHKMVSGDIGEKQIEELNLIEPGNDYGWNYREGPFVINRHWETDIEAGEKDEVFELPENDSSFGYTYPVAMYDHDDDGYAIAGGYFYRGSAAHGLYGKYLCGDIKTGMVVYVEADSLENGKLTPFNRVRFEYEGKLYPDIRDMIDDNSRADLRFGYDELGNLYLSSKRNAMIYKVVDAVDTAKPFEGESNSDSLINISTRGTVTSGIGRLNGSFVIEGGEEKTVLIRAVGPGLDTVFGGNSPEPLLVDPILELKTSNGVLIASNDDWDTDNEANKIAATEFVGAFALAEGSKDAAILITLSEGSYSALVSGVDGQEGLALVEVYDVE